METNYYLDEAISLIRKHGWVQQRFGNIHVGFCLLGAMLNVSDKMNEIRTSDSFYVKARDKVAKALGLPSDKVSMWNDEPERTKEEVLEILEKAKTVE